ncbi:Mov34/MPN/PAD-1 family protein [Geobacter metallireducens RCH3]|uniref:Zinc-dependent isopeptidase n=1 Tax=Geobacter metallireducens (strain ATCC 53774 / DSM 7210 / GS-15) TaxID=269799 RepID=Q39VC3_GEOMG|nr:M67 family metallopeptidase [Geobacter metallireducens]ABB31801.1 zinc-dependent isopeptidase [Geobacter metallireducens GS-15]EHP89317.1 Mov34/MPN/PAD-1 family protein [Geobacter metallireducens RCH3]
MLTIPRAIHAELIAHAQADAPIEACGILGGIDGAVSAIFRMANTDQSDEHFMMDPKEQFAVVKELRNRGLAMLAIYHSHPETPARPSEEDIRLALTPGVSYVIASLAGAEPDVKAFRITDGVVEPEPIDIVE